MFVMNYDGSGLARLINSIGEDDSPRVRCAMSEKLYQNQTVDV